ncbi:hypothetical protein MKW98_032133 [Papaver atlanticum]|uniref:NB-ARC domain-containing protein n=1 Tax=Papaver atlanticum TaxID=357466 RepID=A0AAD4XD72_9MAGN|nr:hypothetical protein MKW98_032133 [Papaver atlanticum]
MYRRVDLDLEDEVLLLNVIAHEILDSMDASIHAVASLDTIRSLKRSLFVVLDVLDAETSKEMKLIRYLSFQHINECLKNKYGDGEKSTAAMRKWMTTVRMLLGDLNNAMDDITGTTSSTDLQRESNQSLSDLSITSLVDRLHAIINNQPLDPHKDIRKLLRSTNSCIIDRPEDEKAVIELLLEPSVDGGMVVIPIVGDSGCGKSVLAKLVYDNQRVKDHFDLIMWISFPDSYPDMLKFSHCLIDFASKSLTICQKKKLKKKLRVAREASTTGNFDINYLQKILGELLSQKKCLLVLDGMSNKTCYDWNALRISLSAGANSSKILLTTRSSKVSSLLGTVPPYCPQTLCNEECCSLFSYSANGYNNTAHLSPPTELLKCFQGMVRLFKGFPSVVAGAGNLVASCIEDEVKLQILGAMQSKEPLTDPFTSDLLWAYHGLSSTHLKQCFAYCALFPKLYLFEKHKLILLWMAEGFLRPKDGMTMEDVGFAYFAELLDKSFLQSKVHIFGESFYCLPEHVYRLAEYVSSSGDGYIKLSKNNKRVSAPSNISEYARYSSFCHVTMNQQMVEAFYKRTGLNTLLLFNTRIGDVSRNLFLNLTRVRVLDLSNAGLSDLPDSICNMTHLRFLDLSKNDINQLPAMLSMLHNLQTLIIDSNVKVLQFPVGMEKLPNLRHLDLGSCQPFVRPPGIEQLTNLQTLRTITVVGRYLDEAWRTGVLRELVNLQELRVTFKFGNLDGKEQKTNNQDILMNMKHLRKLELFWHPMIIENADYLLASFMPHTNVKHLVLRSYGGIKFPAWLGNPSFSNLEIVKVCGCYSCEFLPSLGELPLLIYLRVGEMSTLKYIDSGFCGNKLANERFPSLKTLELVSLSNLERWTGLLDGDMPLLQELNIVGCLMLSSLPTLKFLGSLQKLRIEYCEKLQAFPDEKPPSKLNFLAILYCPLLLETCKDEKDWGKMLETAE